MEDYGYWMHRIKAINERRNKVKKWFKDRKRRRCSICKKTYPYECLDIHHKDPKKKTKNYMWSLSNEDLKIELDGCMLVCANCHRTKHFGTHK